MDHDVFAEGPACQLALPQDRPRPHWYGGDCRAALRGTGFPVGCAYPDSGVVTVLRQQLCADTCQSAGRACMEGAWYELLLGVLAVWRISLKTAPHV